MKARINNRIYEELGERWYGAQDDPVALLRAEARVRDAWAAGVLRARGAREVIDIGCGAGFLANHLADEGFKVVAVDSSPASLATARLHDPTGNVRYVEADALALPLADGSFDAAAAMDFLEHVEDPGRVISEASRVLRPGGVFLFHTFNRTFLAWLLAIKGLEWFVRNTPRNLHVLRLFIKPRELRALCARNGLEVAVFRGLMPVLDPWDLFRLLRTGIVPAEFRFRLTRLPWVGYLGYALKR